MSKDGVGIGEHVRVAVGPSPKNEKVVLLGFSRVQLGHDEKGNIVIDGDSGWLGPNEITNFGFANCIVKNIGTGSGGSTVSHMALGTGTAPNVTHTSLDEETGARKATTNTVESSKTHQSTAAWASGDNPGECTIKNIGLYCSSDGSNLVCGNTYTASTWATNQGVSATYQLRFGTTSSL